VIFFAEKLDQYLFPFFIKFYIAAFSFSTNVKKVVALAHVVKLSPCFGLAGVNRNKMQN